MYISVRLEKKRSFYLWYMHFKCSFIIHYPLMPAIEGLFN